MAPALSEQNVTQAWTPSCDFPAISSQPGIKSYTTKKNHILHVKQEQSK